MQYFWLQHVEAQISKRIQYRPKMKPCVSLSAVVGTIVCVRPCRDARNHFLARTDTSVIAYRAAIDAAVDKDAIHPTFQNRRRTELPEREVHDQQVTAQQAFHLGIDIFRRCVVLCIKPLLCLRMKDLGILPNLIVLRTLARIKIH